ncbi:TetR family transcriptional regulator C-terminal domain-containing protein [Catenuloplanes nepalensis]|uniref:TetR family transcriptional regulator C-terminal domain-containing protein n=1 Tax=Catenuloplanes nepalensis TaxID=587533 RepID=UPI0035212AF5
MCSRTCASRDERIGRILAGDRRRRHDAVALAVRAGQADGSITREEDPADLTWTIAGLIAGIRVNAAAQRLRRGAAPHHRHRTARTAALSSSCGRESLLPEFCTS